MSFSTSDLVSVVETAMAAGANPYEALDAVMWTTLDKGLPESFFVQLYCQAGGLGFNLLLVVLVLSFQIAFRKFWIYRYEAGSLRPHGTTPWLLLGGTWYILAEVVIFRSIHYYRGEELVRELIGLRTLMWVAPWTGGWIAAHALAASFLTHLQSTGEIVVVEALRWHRRLTAFFYGTLVVFFASIVPLAVLAISQYHKSLDSFEEIDTMLLSAAAAYNGTFEMSSLTSALPALEALTSDEAKLVKTLHILYTLYGAWGLVLEGAFVTAAFLYTRSLGRTLARSEALKSSAELNSAGEVQMRQFRKTYRTLVVTMWAFSAIASGFVGVSFFVGTKTNSAMNNVTAIQVVDLTMYYLYLAAGAPVGLLVLFRVLRTHQLENGISHFRSDSDRTFSRNSHRFPRKPRPFSNLDVTVDISTVVELHSPAAQSRKSVVSVGEGFEMEVKSPSTPDFEREAAKSEDLYYLALGKEEGQRSTEKR